MAIAGGEILVISRRNIGAELLAVARAAGGSTEIVSLTTGATLLAVAMAAGTGIAAPVTSCGATELAVAMQGVGNTVTVIAILI